MLRIVISALGLAACIFAFSANNSTVTAGTPPPPPPPCDINCSGSALCTLIVDGMPVVVAGVNLMEGDPIEDIDNENKEVPIACKDLNFSNSNNTYQGNATNTAGADSRVALQSRQAGGVPFYPASATVYSYVDIELNGKAYTSADPIVLNSMGDVQSWPSEDFVEYEVAEDVTFQGESSELTIQAGSTVTMKKSD